MCEKTNCEPRARSTRRKIHLRQNLCNAKATDWPKNSGNTSMIIFASCLNFWPGRWLCARVGGSSRAWIPSMSHTEPTRSWSVGIALYGAVVHSKAWASSLRVASSGADMDPKYPSADNAYILKSVAPRGSWWIRSDSLDQFSTVLSNDGGDLHIQSWRLHSCI